MKMQQGLLSDKFDDRDTNASVVELVKNMADGTGAHHAGALKLGLRKRFSSESPTPAKAVPSIFSVLDREKPINSARKKPYKS